MSNTIPKNGQVSHRRGLKKLRKGDVIGPLPLELVEGEVVSNEVLGGQHRLTIKNFRIAAWPSSDSQSTSGEHEDVAILSGDSVAEDLTLSLTASPSQRILTRGISEEEMKAMASAPAEQLAAVVVQCTDDVRRHLVEKLFSSMSPTEVSKLLKDRGMGK